MFPCEDSIRPVAAVREQSALYHVSFACVHRVLREVCSRFLYLLPFPSLSHRFDHEIHEDQATQEVNPFIIWYQQLLVATDFSSIWSFPHKFENFTKHSPNSCFGSICDLSVFW